MEGSTLPPMPSFNPNIPVVTSAGGSSAAYKNKNSPESIMRDLHTLQVQTVVDTKYDVAESPYEKEKFMNPPDTLVNIIAVLVILCWSFLIRYHSVKKGKEYLKFVFLGLLCIVSFLLYGRYK